MGKGYALVQVIGVIKNLSWRILYLDVDRLKVKRCWLGHWLRSWVVFLDLGDVIGMMIDVIKHSLIFFRVCWD